MLLKLRQLPLQSCLQAQGHRGVAAEASIHHSFTEQQEADLEHLLDSFSQFWSSWVAFSAHNGVLRALPTAEEMQRMLELSEGIAPPNAFESEPEPAMH